MNPVVLLLIYTFVFGVVFRARWPQAGSQDLTGFAVTLFAGLVVINTFGEMAARAPTLVVNVPNYVKKVVFPLELLPVSALGSSLFHALVSLAILIGGHLLTGGTIGWTVLLLPVVWLPLVCLALGFAWFLSSLGVFVRDIGHFVMLVVMVLPFVTPTFFPLSAIPPPFDELVRLNPLTAVVEDTRRTVLWSQLPAWETLGRTALGSAAFMLLGYAWFMKTKKAFADVI